jgi:hypothetical protein
MKKKMRKFADGGFTPAQEEWLGGADRTDPFILARMREAIPDEVAPAKSREQVQDEQEGYVSAPRKMATPKSIKRTVVKTEVTPDTEKKPYIDIPKNASIGMRQFASDAESPVGKLWRSMTGSKSQRTTAAEKKMKKGGAVKSSASSRGDGCAQRGKTKGRMV